MSALTEQSISDFIAHLRLNGASENTQRAYRADLCGALAFARTMPTIDVENVLGTYLGVNRGTWAPKTTERKLGTFRSWARWAGLPPLLPDYILPTPAPSEPHPIPEGIAGVLAMIASSNKRNPTHRALLAMSGLMGLRINEIVKVTVDDFDMHEMDLTVRGKGDKVRRVPVVSEVWAHLEPAYRKAEQRDDKRLVPLTNRGARASFSRHGRRAGLSRHVASHDGRATFLTAAYQNTHDLRAVQELAGHADSKTTQAYTLVSRTAKRAAAGVV